VDTTLSDESDYDQTALAGRLHSNDFKLHMIELASGACIAQIARDNGVNDNVIFKWIRAWQVKTVYHAAFR